MPSFGPHPAKEIRKRFSEEKIEQLLAIRWWDWPIEKITQHVQLLTGKDIDGLAQQG
jgi:virginiamycin A acetyltransferase